MEVLNFKNILVKKPWFKASPVFTPKLENVSDKNRDYLDRDSMLWNVYTQEDMLREYYPSGHKIMNSTIYPDIYRQDPETKRWHIQPITRCTVAMQQLITTKRSIHSCGNDIQFELSDSKTSEKQNDADNELLSLFKRGWIGKNMEINFYEAVNSLYCTAEACIVGYFDKGKFGTKVLTFKNGDKLYPHYDSLTGELTLFARKYYDYDEEGKVMTEYIEVWDDTYYYVAKSDPNSKIEQFKSIFGLEGYKLVTKKRHGFSEIPVAYHRDDDGPCWINAQNTIEHYEEAISYFFENNKAFAFPILVLQGEGIELHGDEITGAVKSIEIEGTDGKAGFLEGNDVSASYKALLDIMYNLIYEQAFSVKPPELKSGDLPGVALKLLYSPAIEKAIDDAQKLNNFLQKLVWLVKFGWGYEAGMQASLLALDINAWIEPYVHQNDTELITNLTTAVQNKILSKRTASERDSKFSKNNEFERIMREMKEAQQLEIEKEETIKTHATDEEIRKAKATNSGQDVNTGGGGGQGRTTDKWGNHEGENNWTDWNNSH